MTAATGAKKAETVFEAPGSLGDIEAPRTPGLGDSASMSEMLQSGAVPGFKGVQLTDKVSDPAQFYGDMFKLSQGNGVEYAVTRENGDLFLRSGAADKVRVPVSADPIAHTHPFDPETELPQKTPSRADVHALNRRWERNPDGPRPASDIAWGSKPNQVTRYHATA